MVSCPKKIVFYRIGAIGDIIHTLPLIKLTREINPQARIEYIVGSKQIADLLNNNKLNDLERTFNQIFSRKKSEDLIAFFFSLEKNL